MDKNDTKYVYWTIFAASLVFFSFLCGILKVITDRVFFEYKIIPPLFMTPMIFFSIYWSNFFATRICRRMGISQDRCEISHIKRGAIPFAGDWNSSFELKASRTLFLVVACLSTLFSLFILISVLIIPCKTGTEIVAFFLAAMVGVAAVGLWVAYFFKLGLFVARVDEHGVTAQRKSGFGTNFVSWEEIESCEVTAKFHATGRLTQTFFVFRNESGKQLLKLLIVEITEENKRKFQAVIEHYLFVHGK